jgi:hypothetical protein
MRPDGLAYKRPACAQTEGDRPATPHKTDLTPKLRVEPISAASTADLIRADAVGADRQRH